MTTSPEHTTAAPAPAPRASDRPDRSQVWRWIVDLIPTLLTPFVGIAAAFGLVILILTWQGADPRLAWEFLYDGTLASAAERADLVSYWMPLAITAAGLVLTYNAGLWNIGVEGQVIAGAIGATWAARLFAEGEGWTPGIASLSHGWVLLLSFVFAAITGGLWAMLAGVLKTRGGVNEIFGGVALNFIIQTFNMYLVSNGGPWQPVGSRATETAAFPEVARLTSFGGFRHLSLTPVYITAVAFVILMLIMYVSRWGLQLRAMGKNLRSAFLLGVHTERNVLMSMMLCGMMAGLAGSFRVMGPYITRAKLTANPSGGIGFLAILIVLLAGMSALLTPFVSFAFAVLSKGAQKIESGFQWSDPPVNLDRSLVRVLQSTIVLMVVLAFGARNRFFPPRSAQPVTDDDDEVART
ncbi:MAG: ABC transporter permease [Chloroflexi bacterium]|nr:ABC transporter permease [Chloroflexota bacterium]